MTWNMVEDTDVLPPFEGANVNEDLRHPPFNNVGSVTPDGNITGAYHGTIHWGGTLLGPGS